MGQNAIMTKIHSDEVDIDIPLVRRLLAAQFPQWAGLPIEPVQPLGTDNAIYRLGDAMAIRLPRRERTSQVLEKELQWLPRLPHSCHLLYLSRKRRRRLLRIIPFRGLSKDG